MFATLQGGVPHQFDRPLFGAWERFPTILPQVSMRLEFRLLAHLLMDLQSLMGFQSADYRLNTPSLFTQHPI